MTARRRLLLASLALLAGCGKKEPPSGGPPDIDPPRIASSTPDSGAASVPRTGPLTITFSEGMEPRSTGDAVALAPRVDIGQRRWKGRTLTVTLADTLRSDQTYTLFVATSARDRHGNNLEGGGAVVFSTAPAFPPGVIEGQIEARGYSAIGTYLWGYAGGRVPDSTARDFDAIGLADQDGRFRITGLMVPQSYRLWAFADLNGNRSFEPTADVLAPVDTTFALTAERPAARDVKVLVVNPRAPGRVQGTVRDTLAAADSVGLLRVLATSARDSTRRVQVDAEADGTFRLEVPAGEWLVRAYRDRDDNRTFQPRVERSSAPAPVTVPPAGDVVDVVLWLGRDPASP